MPQPTSEFANKIYELLRRVPMGKVTTYKDLAEALGTKAYQAVGTTMKNNPYAPEVACHRVVKSDGSLGGFMGTTTGKNIEKKKKMLQKEGVEIKKGKVVNFEKKRFRF